MIAFNGSLMGCLGQLIVRRIQIGRKMLSKPFEVFLHIKYVVSVELPDPVQNHRILFAIVQHR